MYCKKCGKEIDPDSIFCGYCGFKLSSDSSEPIATEVRTQTAKKDEKEYLSQYPVHPWIRYFARMIDLWSFTLIGGFALGAILVFLNPRIASPLFENDWAIVIVLLGIWVLLEPMLLAHFGTTAGKYLLNIRVKSKSGRNLTYMEALNRTIGVFVAGLGLCLPLISLVTLILAHSKLKKDSTTTWDEKAGSVVLHGQIGGGRVAIFFLAIALMALIVVAISS